MCQRKSAVIEKNVSQIFSAPIKIRLIIGDAEEPVSKEQSAKKSNEPAPQVSRQQRQEALNDPAVQMILKGLEATPLEIQKIDIRMDDAQMEAVEESTD